MKTEAKKDEPNYEIKYITIPVPKDLVSLTTVMLYETSINGKFGLNTISYATKELKELEKSDIDDIQ